MLSQMLGPVTLFIKNLCLLLAEIGPYFLIGLFVAGLVRVYLPQEKLRRHLGGRGWAAVFKAAALGLPLPLCSCGVLPVAISLYRHGASLPATLAFLVATPQTGADAILITLGLFGPLFTLAYALAALLAGVFSGLMARLLFAPQAAVSSACECLTCLGEVGRGLRQIVWYAYGDLLRELSRPLTVGLLLGALLVSLFPPGFLGELVPRGPLQYLVLLTAGVPLYMCSTGSVPLAYGLYLQGFSPGSLLVFLMTGPATNVTSLTVIRKVFGGRLFWVYLLSLILFALAAGVLLDLVSLKLPFKAPSPATEGVHPLKVVGGVILAFLLCYHLLRPFFGDECREC